MHNIYLKQINKKINLKNPEPPGYGHDIGPGGHSFSIVTICYVTGCCFQLNLARHCFTVTSGVWNGL